MVSTPRNRHSRTDKEPVTLDLEAERAADENLAGQATSPAGATAEQDAAAAEPSPPAPDAMAGGEAESNAEPSSARPRPSIPALLLAGVVGGAVALGGAFALHRAGVLDLQGRDVGELAGLERLELLDGEISDLRAGLTRIEGAGGVVADRLEEMDSRIAEIRAEIDAAQSSPALPDGLSERLEALENRSVAPPDGAAAAVPEERLVQLASETGAAQEAARAAQDAASANANELARLRQELAQLAGRIDAESSRPEVALAIAAVALKSAIDSGSPFTLQLETYASVAATSPEIEALREMAASGVPTWTEIAAQAPAAANAIVAATSRVEPEAGYLQRVLASLRSLVKVRPVGMVEGNSPAAIAARMEVAIQNQDLEAAIAEFETLPPEAQQAGEDFIAGVRARIEADRLIDRALAAALRTAG